MVKNHHLARAVSDVGIGNFYRTLQYKLKAVGKNLIVAGRWYPSSKRCPECGAKKERLTLKEREWRCAQCGHEHDRDEAAARNLRHWVRLSESDKHRYGRNGRALEKEAIPF